jgi:hypothetical protein
MLPEKLQCDNADHDDGGGRVGAEPSTFNEW